MNEDFWSSIGGPQLGLLITPAFETASGPWHIGFHHEFMASNEKGFLASSKSEPGRLNFYSSIVSFIATWPL